MIKMSELVTEVWSNRTLDDLLLGQYLPISYTIAKDAFNVVKGKAVHAAAVSDFENLIKLQDTRKIIPAATWWTTDGHIRYEFLKRGAASGASTMSILAGDIVMRFRYDAMTSTEKGSGRKWINLEKPISGAFKADNSSIIVDIINIKKKIYGKVIKKYPNLKGLNQHGHGLAGFFFGYKSELIDRLGEPTYKKLKNQIITDMVDELTKYEKKHSKDITKLFDHQNMEWNEVLITNFKIEKVYIKDDEYAARLHKKYPKIRIIHWASNNINSPAELSKILKKDITK